MPRDHMQARLSSIAAMAALFSLSACGGAEPDSGPGAVTESEAQALDEAAEMLDARALPPEVLPNSGTATGAPLSADEEGAPQDSDDQ